MLSRLEIMKDNLQEVVEAGTNRTSEVMNIITHAVADVTKEVGGFANDLFEISEASERARDAQSNTSDTDSGNEE